MFDEMVTLYEKELIEIRRELHKIPEIGLDTFKTTNFIEEKLNVNNILNHRLGSKKTGLVAVIDTGKKDTIGIRADIDALQIVENTHLQYSSTIKSNMHACGHDAHGAIALITALISDNVKEKLTSNVVFIFQPGEEGYHGAKDLINNGLKDIIPFPKKILALHISPDFSVGQIAFKMNTIMASLNTINILIKGKEGHDASPHNSIDPIYASSQLIVQAQSLVSRINNPSKPVVLSFGSIRSENTGSGIPGKVLIKGALRCISDDSVKVIKVGIENILKGLATVYGIKYEYDFGNRNYPVTANSKELFDKLSSIFIKDIELISDCFPRFGADDFGYYSNISKILYVFLGCSSSDFPPIAQHRTDFIFDEKCLSVGVRFFINCINQMI